MTQTDLDVFYPAIEVSDSPTPKPIPTRLCACKCGHRFQPRRSNQKYINKQHADFGYNHHIRKPKEDNQIKIEKILSKNDAILERYYQLKLEGEFMKCYFMVLKADGFNFGYNIGKKEQDSVDFYFSYNYFYTISLEGPHKIVKIFKR